MRVRWLGWAGAESPRARARSRAGLCTHLHRDHTDARALSETPAPGSPVYHPHGFGGDEQENLWLLEADAERDGYQLARQPVEPWQTMTVGPFTVSGVPAVDTLGDPQVA
ncbi:MAG TPA: hypothetical protein VIG48_10850 [Jatrophihabitans sp.]|jgi:hypothetical protein